MHVFARFGTRLTQVSARILAAKPSTWLFALLFFGFTWQAIAMHARERLGPGQDFHYHTMAAAILARESADPIKQLYAPIVPWLPNTLIYYIAWPFERLTHNPLVAINLAMLVAAYVGFPCACAYALARTQRSLWGALLAFPVIYCKSWSNGGYLPFVSAAAFLVLAAAEFQVLHAKDQAKSRRPLITCALALCLTFMAHSHVYVWLASCLGFITILILASALLAFPRIGFKAAILNAASAGIRSLIAIAPSLVMFTAWYRHTHYGPAVANSNTQLVRSEELFSSKITELWAVFVHTKHIREYECVALLFLTCIFVALVVRRPAKGWPVFEAVFLLTLVSYFILPNSVNGQTIALRHLDMSTWLLPVVILPASALNMPFRKLAAIAAVFAYSALRTHVFAVQLDALNIEEFSGLVALSKVCRSAHSDGHLARIAYVSPGEGFSSKWHAVSLEQPHETVAAICSLDTPVYDGSIYPHNLLPLHYNGPLPAPVTMLQPSGRWYEHAGLWENFEFVLVRQWTASAADRTALESHATLVGHAGNFELWRRK